MGVLERVKVGLGIGLVLVVASVVMTTVDKSGDDKLALSVTWQPATLTKQLPAIISVYVDGTPVIRLKTRYLSPYVETMTAERGAKVELVASTGNPKVIMIDCAVLRNGVLHPGARNQHAGPGTVVCVS